MLLIYTYVAKTSGPFLTTPISPIQVQNDVKIYTDILLRVGGGGGGGGEGRLSTAGWDGEDLSLSGMHDQPSTFKVVRHCSEENGADLRKRPSRCIQDSDIGTHL